MEAQYEGDLDRAAAYLEASLPGLRESDDRVFRPQALRHLGMLALDSGQLTRARSLLKESLSLAWRLGNTFGIPIDLDALAGLAAAQQQPARALTQDSSQGAIAYAAFSAVTLGLRSAGRVGFGAFLVLAGAALRARDVPRPLSYVAILAGIGDALGDAFVPAGVVGGVLGIIWLVWVGVLLLAAPAPAASPARTTAAVAAR